MSGLLQTMVATAQLADSLQADVLHCIWAHACVMLHATSALVPLQLCRAFSVIARSDKSPQIACLRADVYSESRMHLEAACPAIQQMLCLAVKALVCLQHI